MTAIELAHGLVRGLHVAASLSVFGAAIFRAIVVPAAFPDDATGVATRRITLLIRLSLVVAIVAAGAWLLLEARGVASEDDTILGTIPIVLLELRFGWLLIARLVLLTAAVVLFAGGVQRWQRTSAAALAACAVALQAGLGHGASMDDPMGWGLTIVEALHLLAAGAWLGGLFPLYIVIGTMEPAAALTATRRFSRLGIACVIVLTGTILIQGWVLIGGLAGLIGTDYGQVASAKLILFAVLLGFAAANRFRHMPLLSGPEGEGRRALRRSIAGETIVGLCVVLAAGILLTLPPAIQQQPNWPFPYQFSLATQGDPDLRNETLLGATQAIGAFALFCLACAWRRARWIAATFAALLAWWSAPHLSLLLAPAYPTSFYHSTSGFTAASIAHGAELFAGDCVACHGVEGRGNGPQAKDLPIPPADLTAPHLFEHSDGEMFWWLTHGIEGPDGNLVMPGFGDRFDADERWNLIDYLRARNAGFAITASGQRPHAILAPDMTVTTNAGSVSLRSLRGHVLRIVAMGDNGKEAPSLPSSDLAIMTIPLAQGSDAWRAYAIVAGVAPGQLAGTEFLVDSDGWLRRLFRPDASPDPATFLSAARDAEANPIEIGSASRMHHHMSP